jgi:DNA polymerase
MKLLMDTETFSACDITTAGGFKYTSDNSTRLICLAYKIDEDRTRLWYTKASGPPDDLVEAAKACSSGQGKAYAFNATFDLRIWNKCVAPAYSLPFISVDKWVDIQAVCARYKLPQNLRQAGQALGCTTEKMATGLQSIKKCCIPGGNPTDQNFADLCQYCMVDTDVLSEIMERLPTCCLAPMEQELWEMTYRMNDIGVPIDITEVDAIIKYLKIYMDGQSKILPEITKGFVNTPGQVQKIKQFCKMQGVDIPDTKAETVEAFLAREDLPYEVRTVLRLRQELGKSSVKKFLTLHQMHNNGVVQGNLNYHGAGTGRWAGRGFQYHNLPRAKVANPEEVITKFVNRDFMEDPVGDAKAVIRSMIKAPDNKKLIVSDYSSIENRVLAWLAGDTLTLDGFRNKFDQYKDMASFLFNKPASSITKEERQLGKALILGCGYGMSSNRFVVAAQSFGLTLSAEQAKFAVDAYRKKYYLIVKMWYAQANVTKYAVQHPGKEFSTHRCKYKVVKDHANHTWLRLTLPSGRALMYMNPRLAEGKYGPAVLYKGVNPTTFQWSDKELTPGLLAENVTQAASRDILCEGMLEIQNNMPEATLILCVHDEAGALIDRDDITDGTMDKFNKLLCVDNEYRKDLPLAAEGYIARRYRKD